MFLQTIEQLFHRISGGNVGKVACDKKHEVIGGQSVVMGALMHPEDDLLLQQREHRMEEIAATGQLEAFDLLLIVAQRLVDSALPRYSRGAPGVRCSFSNSFNARSKICIDFSLSSSLLACSIRVTPAQHRLTPFGSPWKGVADAAIFVEGFGVFFDG